MNDSVTQIKLFGPGIPRALQELNKIKPEDVFNSKVKRMGSWIGEKADYEIIWKTPPTSEATLEVCKYLDDLLEPCKCRYSISTSIPGNLGLYDRLDESRNVTYSFLRIFGPRIFHAIYQLNTNIGDIPGIKEVRGELLGEYDYALEWIGFPNVRDITNLLKKIDELFVETKVTYQISTVTKVQLLKSSAPEVDQRPERILRFI
ncbi:MAG: hypothetical protein ACTSR4_01985 [Candidatus Hodarchaeales archaeon]